MQVQKLVFKNFKDKEAANNVGELKIVGKNKLFKPKFASKTELIEKIIETQKKQEKAAEFIREYEEYKRTYKFSEDDLTRTKNEAFEKGFDKGYQSAKSEDTKLQQSIADSLQAIVANIKELSQTMRNNDSRYKNEIALLSIAIARKLTADFFRQTNIKEIESLVGETMHLLFDEPKLVIYVSSEILPKLLTRIESIKEQAHFAGEIILKADANIGHNDCNIKWHNGSLISDKNKIIREVEHIFNDMFMIIQKG